MLERRVAIAGIARVNRYVFRHAAAPYAMEHGLGDDAVMRLFGWRTRTMLDRNGVAVAEERARAAHGRLRSGGSTMNDSGQRQLSGSPFARRPSWRTPGMPQGVISVGLSLGKRSRRSRRTRSPRPATEDELYAGRVAALECRLYVVDILLLESDRSHRAEPWQHNLLTEDRQFGILSFLHHPAQFGCEYLAESGISAAERHDDVRKGRVCDAMPLEH